MTSRDLGREPDWQLIVITTITFLVNGMIGWPLSLCLSGLFLGVADWWMLPLPALLFVCGLTTFGILLLEVRNAAAMWLMWCGVGLNACLVVAGGWIGWVEAEAVGATPFVAIGTLNLLCIGGVSLPFAPGRCPRCGYQRRGLRSDGCPECGWGRSPAGQ